jgi:NAD-dependent DNA ligase
MGGVITTSISKNTYIVVTNEPNGITSKLNKARDLGIPILTILQFHKKFKIKN